MGIQLTLYPTKDAVWDGTRDNPTDYGYATVAPVGELYNADQGGFTNFGTFDFDFNQIRTDIPISTITFRFYVQQRFISGGYVYAHTYYLLRQMVPWTERLADGHPGVARENEDPDPWVEFDVPGAGWINVDVTALYSRLRTKGGYGFKLFGPLLDGYSHIRLRESGSTTPSLLIEYANSAPNAPVLQAPAQGGWYNTGNPMISWSFSDNDPGDTQTAWHVQIADVGRGGFLARSSTLQAGSQNSWNAYGALPTGNYYAIVKTKDSYGVESPWSAQRVFYIDLEVPTGTVQGHQNLSVQPGGTFRVHAYNATDNYSGVSMVRFPTSAPGYGFTWYDGVNAGGGTWYFDVPIANYNNNEGVYTTHVYADDIAGNRVMLGEVRTYVDRTKANDPNVLAANIKANSVTFTWNGFSDPGPSSGYWKTQLYVRKNGVPGSVDIDSNGSFDDFLTFTDNRTSYAVNNLAENTSYSFVVTHYDLAGNESSYTWKTVQTNNRPTAQLFNLTSLGYLISPRPKFRMSGNDTEGSAMNFHIQISNSNVFATTIVDSFAVGGTGWSIGNAIGNGIVNTFTPQVDLGTGTKYVRVQTNDGQDWGNWSAVIPLVIQAPNFAGVIAASDMTASKRWIDDLRTKTNAIRQARGLSVVIWTDPVIRDWNDTLGGTLIRDVHLTELRTALQDVASIFGNTLTWTRPSLAGQNRSGQDWLDLRSAAVTL